MRRNRLKHILYNFEVFFLNNIVKKVITYFTLDNLGEYIYCHSLFYFLMVLKSTFVNN